MGQLSSFRSCDKMIKNGCQTRFEGMKMIPLMTGASHTGKTLLAQKILEEYQIPYLSMDLLKMGLIRSNYVNLTPKDDDALQGYMWPMVREMIKTAIENRQNLVMEGAYIPFGWEKDFSDEYLREIQYKCLVMSRRYIENHFLDIRAHACDIEKRIDDSWCTMEFLIAENARYLDMCEKHQYPFMFIDEGYEVDVNLSIEHGPAIP